MATSLPAAVSELEKYLMDYTRKDLLGKKEVRKFWTSITKHIDQKDKSAEKVNGLLVKVETEIEKEWHIKLKKQGKYLTLKGSVLEAVENDKGKTKDMKGGGTAINKEKDTKQQKQSPTPMDDSNIKKAFQRLCQEIAWLYDVIKGEASGLPLDTETIIQLDPSENLLHTDTQKKIHEILDAFRMMNKGNNTSPLSAQMENDIHNGQPNNKLVHLKDDAQEREAAKRLEELVQENAKLHNEVQVLNQDLQRFAEEKDALMIRMSKMAGDKLTHNNPEITDLSDPNRPQKLAEKYGELYDNEWTDAIVKLNPGNNEKHDRTCIDILSAILEFCYSECERIADNQLSQLEIVCLNPKVVHTKQQVKPSQGSDVIKRFILDAQHSSSLFTVRAAVDMVKESLTKHKELREKAKQIPVYTEKCIEICWSMVTHHPRLFLLWPDVSKEKQIRFDMFQAYTRSGDLLDYVVWPAMFLYKDGPLLRKGTVQPVAR